MLKLIKWLIGLLVGATILVVIALVVISSIIDPNDYREELAALVKDKTGRELELNGDLSISVFPWLGVKTQGLSLSQPDGIEGKMVSVDTAQLRVKFAPLLSKKVEVDTVVLERPMIKLVTLANGRDSFYGLSDDTDEAEEVESDSATAAVALAIQGVELTDGTVIIDDRQAGSLMELRKLNLVTGNLIGDSLADISANGELKDSASPDLTLFDLDAKANINTTTFDVRLADLLATVTQGDLGAKLSMKNMTVVDKAQIDISDIEVNLLGEHQVQALIPSVSANLDTQKASVASLTAEYKTITAKLLNLSVTQFIDQPEASGRLEVPAFDARSLIKEFEVDFKPSDSEVLKAISVNADFKGGLEAASIQNLKVGLDQTTLTGSASAKDFEKPKLTFDLSLTDINLDSYLPDSTEEEEDEVSGGEALAVPMAVFKDIYANGRFKASKLISGGAVMTDIDVVVKSTPGNVTITPRANFYEGTFDGAIVYSENGDETSLSVKNSINLVQLSPLLADAAESDLLKGVGTVNVDIVVTEANGKQTNEGTIELLAKDGELSGIDVYNIIDKLNTVANTYSSFSGVGQPEVDDAEVESAETDTTEFSEVIGTFHIKDLLMTNDDLNFKGPGFELTGAGQFDLESESMDYRVNLTILDTIDGVAGDGIQKVLGPNLRWLAGKEVPVHCTGSFEGPTCLPDFKAMYSFYLSSKLNDKKADLLKDKLGIETEEGEKVRTKDIFKKLLLKEAIDDEAEPAQEVPIGERDAQAQDAEAEPAREKTKKELRDERKRKLIEGLFN